MIWKLRLLGAGFLALYSLLAVFRAPHDFFWKPAIGATEAGYLLAFLALPTLLSAGRGQYRQPALLLALLATALLLSPLLRALPVAARLPDQLDAIGAAPEDRAAFSPLRLFLWGRPATERRSELYPRPGGRPPIEVDLYRPAGATGPLPTVVMLHGGAWRSGDHTQLAGFTRWVAGQGYTVAAARYALSGEAPFPAALEDIQALLRWLREGGSQLGVDSDRIALMGRSAGGHLALLAGYQPDSGVRAVVSFYGPTDLEWSWQNPANPLIIDSHGVLTEFLGGPPEDGRAAVYRAASPLNLVGPGTPPTLLIHGGRDELVSLTQSRRLDDALTQVDAPHLLLELPWASHGCEAHPGGPSAQLSHYAIRRFLKTWLAHP